MYKIAVLLSLGAVVGFWRVHVVCSVVRLVLRRPSVPLAEGSWGVCSRSVVGKSLGPAFGPERGKEMDKT